MREKRPSDKPLLFADRSRRTPAWFWRLLVLWLALTIDAIAGDPIFGLADTGLWVLRIVVLLPVCLLFGGPARILCTYGVGPGSFDYRRNRRGRLK